MKVIISTMAIHPFHGSGGMETYYYGLAKHLVKANVDVEIISPFYTDGRCIEKKQQNGINYTFLPPKFDYGGVINAFRRIFLVRRFDKNVGNYLTKSNLNFDVLHGSSGMSSYIKVPNHKPIVLQPFGMEELKLGSLIEKIYNYSMYYPQGKIEMQYSDAIASEGEANTQEILSLFKVPREKIFTLPNGVDLYLIEDCLANSEINREDYGIQDADLVLVNVNKLIPHKGVHYLVDAMKILNDKLNTKLILIGSGSQEEKLKEQIKRNKLQDKVIHSKNIPTEKLFAFYDLADISVTPTLYEGGCPPFVVLEAMAVGKPIVTTDILQMQDAVKDGWNGFLVPPRNPKAIADAILNIYDKGLIKKMGNNSKEMAKKYDWNIIAKRAIKKYEELIRK